MHINYLYIFLFDCFLFEIMLYIQVTNFSVMCRYLSWVNQYKALRIKYLAQGHNTALIMPFESVVDWHQSTKCI